VTRPAAALLALTALLALLEMALPSVGYAPPGTSGALGVVGCLLLIGVAKLLGKAWVERPEDHDD